VAWRGFSYLPDWETEFVQAGLAMLEISPHEAELTREKKVPSFHGKETTHLSDTATDSRQLPFHDN